MTNNGNSGAANFLPTGSRSLNNLGLFSNRRLRPLTKYEVAMFAHLVAYKEKFGDCDVPRHFYGIKCLAWWVVCQRNLRSAGKLEQDFIRRLDLVGFVWDRENYLWCKMYSALCQRLNSAGVSSLESALQGCEDLSKWVRGLQSAKKRGTLSQQKQSALEKVGFPWEFQKKPIQKPEQSSKPGWEAAFARLAEFHKLHGHCA